MTTAEGSGTDVSQQSDADLAISEADLLRRAKNEAAIRVIEAILARVPDDPQGEWERFKESMDAERPEGQKLFS
jgi:hypothetical protein